MGFIVFLGRIFFSAIFIMASFGHFHKQTILYATSQGLPWASFLVPLSGVVALLGGLSILFGYKARWGALLIVIFLVPVTLTMHKFWGISDPIIAGLQRTMFMKNLSMLGGALFMTYFGAGPWSFDSFIRNQKRK